MSTEMICLVPGCGRMRQVYSTAGKFGGKEQFLKTCSRHSIADADNKNQKTAKSLIPQ
jgi:hypothetical protein